MITRKMDMQYNESRIITAILKVVATAELYDPDATEETIRYCVEQDLEDAGFDVSVELLKEQEPRVLTPEEVQNDCPDYVYLETTSGWFERCIKDEGESDIYLGYFVYGIDEYFMEQWREYGKTWRCWSARPTDGQRKVEKWDE